MERFLYRLSQSLYAQCFILKGGMMLNVWRAAEPRSTMDIDVLGKLNNVENTIYQGGPEFLTSLTLPDSDPLSPNLNPLSPNLNPLSPNLDPLSPNLEDLPMELKDMVERLGLRAKPEASHRVILALCNYKSYSKKQLAYFLKRREDTVGDLLKDLLEHGDLALSFPEVPNHPQQTYRTVLRGGIES